MRSRKASSEQLVQTANLSCCANKGAKFSAARELTRTHRDDGFNVIQTNAGSNLFQVGRTQNKWTLCTVPIKIQLPLERDVRREKTELEGFQVSSRGHQLERPKTIWNVSSGSELDVKEPATH